MIEDTYEALIAPLNINSLQLTFKRHDMDKLYDIFPQRNIISCTYWKSNTIKDGYSFIKC